MTTRRLAAILAADVVGFSRLIGEDETGTLAALRAIRKEIVNPALAEHGGRVFKLMGDGLLAEFPSAVQALEAAMGMQERLRERNAKETTGKTIEVRIGIHQGDVVVEGNDLLGDGVNIAARLEALAEPGGICISGRVREDAVGKLSLEVDDLGEPELKNIAQRHRVFRVRLGEPARPALPLPAKPSLAVLPFANLSDDPKQEYFADGMVEDITTALSRIGGLFVIARNSSFTYKGRAVDVKQVGRDLGVRYVLEGSVRKVGNRVRITCQLINAPTGAHIWADRFDSTLDDIFELQDRVTESVAGAIEPALRYAEIERALNKPTNNLDAYDLYLRALYHRDQYTTADEQEAWQLLRQAIALDQGFALAKALAAATCGYMARDFQCVTKDGPEVAEAIRLARSALATARDDPNTLGFAGHAVAYLDLDKASGRIAVNRALALSPNSANILLQSGWLHVHEGDWLAARNEFVRAMRLSPRDPRIPDLLNGLGVAMTELGEVERALQLIRESVATNRSMLHFSWTHLIHCLVLLGRMDEARSIVREVIAADPNYTIAAARENLAAHTREVRERRLASLLAAGIPE
jgi:adenylate cyclase